MFLWFLLCKPLVTSCGNHMVVKVKLTFSLLPKLGSLPESLRRCGTVAAASLKILMQSVLCSYRSVWRVLVIPKPSAHVPFMKLTVDAVQEGDGRPWYKWKYCIFFNLCYALMPGLYQLDLRLSKYRVQNYMPCRLCSQQEKKTFVTRSLC